MPDIITHYIFGLNATKNIAKTKLYSAIAKNRALFFLGCQGPDPMFYHDRYKEDNFSYVAAAMHNSKTKEFIESAMRFVCSNRGNLEETEQLLAYMSGFLCHYILDSSVHPYIFYIGGKYIPGDPDTDKYMGVHRKMELAIDYLILKEAFDLEANKFKVHKHILKAKPVPKIILDLYEFSLRSTYDIKNGGQIFDISYRYFRNYFILTYDNFGVKKAVAKAISPALPKEIAGLVDSFSYHKCYDGNIDYLNTSKDSWRHPITGEISNESFDDLIAAAHAKVAEILRQLNIAIFKTATDNADALERFYATVPNISYTTGIDSDDKRPYKYAKF
ncbi:zinc dependent phospholipase C family protein [Candidatus Epulonipiscium viviparus]|uniref:zinc dependent phospholipase C family protein n=1 Tax=Candidatus Epulonipiscium viviparus TaxID=420336 RepID=UPI0027380DED|nr:zinc dependent phospholipase C family protein [Candidatus Epulopiscium viviparus]